MASTKTTTISPQQKYDKMEEVFYTWLFHARGKQLGMQTHIRTKNVSFFVTVPNKQSKEYYPTLQDAINFYNEL